MKQDNQWLAAALNSYSIVMNDEPAEIEGEVIAQLCRSYLGHMMRWRPVTEKAKHDQWILLKDPKNKRFLVWQWDKDFENILNRYPHFYANWQWQPVRWDGSPQ